MFTFMKHYVLILAIIFQLLHVHAQLQPVDYKITSILGGANGDGMNATLVGINNPSGVASYNGSIYFTDSMNHQIRFVDRNGISHLLAGYPTYAAKVKFGNFLANDTIGNPFGISVNSKGEVYFSEYYGGSVRKIYFNETIGALMMVTIAGGGSLLSSNVSALSAKLNNPRGIAISPKDDSVYICDSSNHMIRKIVNSTIYNVVGNGQSGNSADGTLAVNAKISLPVSIAFHPITGELYFTVLDGIKYVSNNGSMYTFYSKLSMAIAFDSNGDLYSAEYYSIYRYSNNSRTLIANIGGMNGFSGDYGNAYNATLSNPLGLVVYENNLYIADCTNQRIRKINLLSNIITTFAGNGLKRYLDKNYGYKNDIALNVPHSTFYNSNTDEVYIADTGNNRVLKLHSLNKFDSSLTETIANQTHISYPMSIIQSETNGDIYIGGENLVLKLSSVDQQMSIFAGTTSTFSGDNYQAISALLNSPAGMCTSYDGSEIYFSDMGNNVIRKIDSKGIISTIAGNETLGYLDGPALNAKFNLPKHIACLRNGDLLISEFGGHRIRKFVASTKVVETIAGRGVSGFSGDGGLATSASIYQPSGIYYNETSSDIYFADRGNGRIRKISNSIITTIAGTGNLYYSGDGLAANLTNMYPNGLVIHPISGALYVSDSFGFLLRIDSKTGKVYKVIGDGTDYQTISFANSTFIGDVSFFTFTSNGDLYISCTDLNVIKKMNFDSEIVYNFIGNSVSGYNGDSKGNETWLNGPLGLFLNSSSGDLFFCDSVNNRIRKVSNGMVKTIAGGIGDEGLAVNANVNNPTSMVLTETDLFFSDMFNYEIRKVSLSNGIISSVVGTNYAEPSQDGNPANQTAITQVFDIVINGNELFFTDTNNFKIRKTNLDGKGLVSTVAGSGKLPTYKIDNVKATSADLNYPRSVAFLPSGEMIIADSENHIIRKVDLNGNISVIAGIFFQNGYSGDFSSDAKNSLLYSPKGLSITKDGRIIFADLDNCRIRMLTPYCRDANYSLVSTPQGLFCNITTVSDVTCFGLHYSNPLVCSGNGVCKSNNNCTCSLGFKGSDCSTYDICLISSNSYLCNTELANSTETIINKFTDLAQLDSKLIEFSSTSSISVLIPSTISQYLEDLDSSLKNTSISVVSSISSKLITIESEILSPIISIVLVKSSSGQLIPVKNLNEPFTLFFDNLNRTVSNNEVLNATCMYFDEGEKKWKSDGIESEITEMIVHSLPDGNSSITFSLTCFAYHLTSFSIIDQNYKKNSKTSNDAIILNNDTVLIAAIVGSIGGLCVVVISVLVCISAIFLLLRRKKKDDSLIE